MLGLLNLFMVAIGFVVGVLSGFFGFGGGFILTPLLISLGFPANISVGTSIVEISMSSLVNSLRHKFLGNVEAKVSLVAVFASVLGSESGVQIIEYLKIFGTQYMSSVVSLAYAIILSFVSAYIIHESLALKRGDCKKENLSLWHKFSEVKVPPLIAISRSNKEKISVWIIILIGFISGLFAGFLGSGGGSILIPLLIYIIGYEPSVAAGTCAFWVLLNSIYASLTHAVKGNIDIMLATLIFIGSLIGIQIGTTATKYVKKTRFELSLGLCLCFVSLSTLIKLFSGYPDLSSLSLLSPIITFILASTVALFIIANLLKERQRTRKIMRDR
ncbi:MAG: sulfite exporter TauE/SafE family protein [Candidatus Bathyarchaeia archaeon]